MSGKKGASPRTSSIKDVKEAKRMLQELYDWKELGYATKEEVFDYVFLMGANRIIALARYSQAQGKAARQPRGARKEKKATAPKKEAKKEAKKEKESNGAAAQPAV
jgi:alpha-glucosidase (family GH31 glycosyl hydrolase)